MVAPAIAWAQAVWSAVIRPSHAQFSVKDMCAMWREVKREGLIWAKSRGPISRMHLSVWDRVVGGEPPALD
eukprot:1388156-Pyramimonas_sp.AAC.1